MNTSTPNNQELGALNTHVAALRDSAPSESDTQQAQQRLMQRLATATPRRPVRPARVAWWTAAGFASLLAVVLLPALMIGSSVAFAEVLRHFRDFETLQMRIETRVGGNAASTNTVTVDRAGNVRVDVDRMLSVIVNVQEKQVLQLLHDAKVASRTPLNGAALKKDDPMHWLDELREFQGMATALPQTRQINGVTAHGFELTIEGLRTTLWASDDGLPLAMEVAQGALVDLQFHFEFDRPIDPATFATTVPDGYAQAGAED